MWLMFYSLMTCQNMVCDFINIEKLITNLFIYLFLTESIDPPSYAQAIRGTLYENGTNNNSQS